METITFEFVPTLERSVFVRYQFRPNQDATVGPNAVLNWGVYSYADMNTGPWEDFRWVAFGLQAVDSP